MKTTLIIFIFVASFSTAAFAAPAPTAPMNTVHIEFNGADGFSTEVYEIPDKKETPQLNLIMLSSGAIEFVCYDGAARNIFRKLDQTVADAGLTVHKYARSVKAKNLVIELSVLNFQGKVQTSKLEVTPCK